MSLLECRCPGVLTFSFGFPNFCLGVSEMTILLITCIKPKSININHIFNFIYLLVPVGMAAIPVYFTNPERFNTWVYEQPASIIPTYSFSVYFYIWLNWIIKTEEDGQYN